MCFCNLSSHSTVKSSAAAAKWADFEQAADQAQRRRPPACWFQHESTPLLLTDVEDMTTSGRRAGCASTCCEFSFHRKPCILRRALGDFSRMCWRVSLKAHTTPTFSTLTPYPVRAAALGRPSAAGKRPPGCARVTSALHSITALAWQPLSSTQCRLDDQRTGAESERLRRREVILGRRWRDRFVYSSYGCCTCRHVL
jgi:hypothetical protein